MAIEHFTFHPDLTDRFVRFGYKLYRGDTHWIPPLKKELYEQLSPQFPFYQKPGNCHRHFLATAGREIVGRVSAMVNRDLRDKDARPVGTIAFFECVHEHPIAKELLDAATGWLRDEHGIRHVWGPMNFDIWHGYRLMTRGFDQKPFFGEPYNKPYYSSLLERCGFAPIRHWHSVELSGRDALTKMSGVGEAPFQRLVERGYRFEPLNMKGLSDELRKLHLVLSRSFSGFLGYTPISLGEFERLFTTSRQAFHPGLFTFVYDETHTLAGFAGAFLDLSDAIRSMKEADVFPRQPEFFSSPCRSQRILFYLFGITPEEARKGGHLGRAAFYYIIRQILKEGYETVLIALMARGGAMARLGGQDINAAQRQYTLYELNL